MTDPAGSPIAGARVTVTHGRGNGSVSNPPSKCDYLLCFLSTQTNGSGDYSVEFDAGPLPQYPRSIGYATVDHEGYEPNLQMVSADASTVIQDFRLRPVRVITVGESIGVSIEPDSSRCTDLEDWWVLSGRCEVFRIVANTAGTLFVEARTEAGDGAPVMFWATTGNYAGVPGHIEPGALSIGVKGGTYLIFVGLHAGPWKMAEPFARRFNVATSLR